MLAEVEVVVWVSGYLQCFWGEDGVERIDVFHCDGIVEDDDAVFVQKCCSFGDDVGCGNSRLAYRFGDPHGMDLLVVCLIAYRTHSCGVTMVTVGMALLKVCWS